MSAAPRGTADYFTKQNLCAKAVHAAYFGHHPLILSPDDVLWLTIAQGARPSSTWHTVQRFCTMGTISS